MQRWRDWAWPMCRRTWRSLIWTGVFSRGCSRTGALRIRATTSTTRADASPHRRLLCWSMRCATGVNASARACKPTRVNRGYARSKDDTDADEVPSVVGRVLADPELAPVRMVPVFDEDSARDIVPER